MRITRKRAPVIYDYKLMGHALESILHYPYLKEELLSTLDWSHHIDNKDNKANQTLASCEGILATALDQLRN